MVRIGVRSWVTPRLEPGLGEGVDEFGRGAEEGASLRLGEIEEHIAVGVEGRAVVEQQASRPTARPETSQFHIIQPQVVK